MTDAAKYLIHANVRTDGVVERSDVVGAIFGQTEGLLGDQLDLRDLQRSSKLGRIDVEIESEGGTSRGRVTIASSLDRVETSVLAAALETISRVGPCRAEVEIEDIEDVRAAKRREVVERATELLATGFDDSILSSEELVQEVRQNVRVADVTEYEGLPAGPHVESSDAVVVVEGRADVLRLLRYGIKNAVAVEGTDVPDAVAELTEDRTATAFLDGDRGGDLIFKELTQVGKIDYVAFAPAGRSVEELSRGEIVEMLRDKVAYEQLSEESDPRAVVTDDPRSDAEQPSEPIEESTPVDDTTTGDAESATADGGSTVAAGSEAVTAGDAAAAPSASDPSPTDADALGDPSGAEPSSDEPIEDGSPEDEPTENEPSDDPPTLRGHVRSIVDDGSDRVRLLDADLDTLDERDASEAFDAISDAEQVPRTVILDGEISQRLLDVAAQRGVERVIGRELGEFTKQPAAVRALTAAEIEPPA